MNYLRSIGRRTKFYQRALEIRAKLLAKVWTKHDQRMLGFYSQFIASNDLCFDVGANRGSRTKIFRQLGTRVVAVEPQAACVKLLEKFYGHDDEIVILQKALDQEEGQAEMMLCTANPISSMSKPWIQAVTKSGRFPNHIWDKKELVQITTLDLLITEYGRPAFIKIDVEGYEYEVLKGLSEPVKALSIEFIPEYLESTLQSIGHLETLGKPTFNYALGETMLLVLDDWVSAQEMISRLSRLENTAGLSGDLYIRFDEI